MSLNFTRNIPLSVIRFRNFCGCPGRFPGNVDLKVAKTRYTLRPPGCNQRQPELICVTILGGSDCILCSKAVLAVRRIIASLGLQLCYQANPIGEDPADRSPSQAPASRSSCCTGPIQQGIFPSGSDLCRSGSEHSGGTTIHREPGSEAFASSGACRGESDDVSLQICPNRVEGERELEDSWEDETQQPASGVVAVHVREGNLNRPADWQHLGLSELDVPALRSEIPIVFVGREQACRLKFSGPAVRVALLRELDKLRRGRGPQ